MRYKYLYKNKGNSKQMHQAKILTRKRVIPKFSKRFAAKISLTTPASNRYTIKSEFIKKSTGTKGPYCFTIARKNSTIVSHKAAGKDNSSATMFYDIRSIEKLKDPRNYFISKIRYGANALLFFCCITSFTKHRLTNFRIKIRAKTLFEIYA